MGTKRRRYVIHALSPRLLERSAGGGKRLDVLDFGCCRLELGRK
jgi:hypothetical protein